MSEISKLIFKGASHSITSPYGKRAGVATSAGGTSTFHNGTDYGTGNVKHPQYAIEDGYIMDANKASDGANYIWIIYPKSKLAMLHYHLDSYCVKTNQKVKKGAKIGVTGKTGKATGIHLHLGIKPLSTVKNVNAVKYADLQKISYVDPEKVKYTVPAAANPNASFLPKKGYFEKGDKSPNIGKVATFMRNTFPLYTDKKALGDTLGPYLTASLKEFQKRTGLPQNGRIDNATLNMLQKFDFKI